MKILTIDIGNTRTHFCVFENEQVILSKNMSTKKILKEFPNIQFDNVAIASTKPKLNLPLMKILQEKFKTFPLILTVEHFDELKNPYDEPSQLGIDRICNVYSLLKYYGSPGLVVDFGTAITIDGLIKNRILPLSIMPGVDMVLRAFERDTSLIRVKEISLEPSVVGKRTVDCLSSGIINAVVGGLKETISKFSEQVGNNFHLIFTGGRSKDFWVKFPDAIFDAHLTLKGIYAIYKHIRG